MANARLKVTFGDKNIDIETARKLLDILADSSPAHRNVLEENIDKVLAVTKMFDDSICQDGLFKLVTTPAKSWKEYAKLNWNREDFRSWIRYRAQFKQPIVRTPGFTCKTCGQKHLPAESPGSPLSASFVRGLTFDQFVKAYPKFVWPKWPFVVKK